MTAAFMAVFYNTKYSTSFIIAYIFYEGKGVWWYDRITLRYQMRKLCLQRADGMRRLSAHTEAVLGRRLSGEELCGRKKAAALRRMRNVSLWACESVCLWWKAGGWGRTPKDLPLRFDKQQEPILTLKLPPQEGAWYREEYAFITEGYYMNKVHWISVRYDLASRDLLMGLMEKSYTGFLCTLTKKQQQLIAGKAQHT